MSWGTELWDQFETLSFHTQKGIDFLERYAHFIRDRCAIEMEYAAKLRRLVKSYQPKKKDEEDYQYSSCKAFRRVMCEVTDLAGQHEVIAENLQSEVIKEVSLFVKDIKEDRKKYLQDGTRYMSSLSSQMASLEKSKKNYEKAFKETERAVENFQRADEDLNLSRAEVEKQRVNMTLKTQHYEDAKNDYANQLQKTNDLQHQHYYISMPEVFKHLQELDEKRICSIKNFMVQSAQIEKNVFPIIDKCLDGIISAANEIDEKEDTALVIERYKSGFSPPGDIPFMDLHVDTDTATVSSTGSKSTISTGNSKSGGLMSIVNHNGVKSESRTIKGTITSSKLKKRGVLLGIFSSNKDDFSDLPPNQRKKKLLQRLDEIRGKIQQETAARDGLMKMKCVYEENPALGDPMSIEGQLNESGHRLDKLKSELQKFQNYYDEIENNSPSGTRKNSILINNRNNHRNNENENEISVTDGRRNSTIKDEPLSRSESESSVTTTQVINNHTPNHKKVSPSSTLMNNGYSNSLESGISTLHTSLPDSEHPEYYEPPPLGTCKALYPFEATSEGSIPMHDGEELFIIELDQGDGWTRVRRQVDHEEGFVPTSYIECTVYNC